MGMIGTIGMNAASNHNIQPKNNMVKPAWDNQETGIRNEIKSLQEKLKNISRDDELSGEQKARQKQAIQEEIQSLNSELRQYQIQKRQEEVRRKQEEARPEPKTDGGTENQGASRTFGSEKLGVIINISLSQDQVSGLEKVRKDLEGKQRTAYTDEEKEKLQGKIDNVSKDIGKKVVITEDAITKSHKSEKADGKEEKEKSANPQILSGRKIREMQRMQEAQNKPFANAAFVM